MGVIVRRANAADIEALVDTQQEGAVASLANIFPQDQYPFPRSAVRKRWTEELDGPDTHVYISVDETGTVIGFAAARDNELLHFGTALRTWGTGAAQQLHAALLDELSRTATAGSDHLRLRVFEENTRAQRFYEKLGWTETTQRTRSSFAPYAVLVEYHRPLPTLADRAD